jgi:hypothetical protein
MQPHRLICSIVFLASMTMTLVNNFFIQIGVLTIVFISIQFCALCWYTLSYIPGGRACCMRCLKSCCAKEGDDRGEGIL